MIDRRLMSLCGGSKKYVAWNVIWQWISLVANIAMMTAITSLLGTLFLQQAGLREILIAVVVSAAAVIVRIIADMRASYMGFLSSREVKKTLREKIYNKLLHLGPSYNSLVNTSEIVQVAVEGVDQLETYFGAYLPQFFYAIAAPLTLFIYLCFFNIPSAVVLVICVPLIPVAIAVVQTFAKKLFSKYWGQYTSLGDTFLENIQGLTTLKIYQSDAYKHESMNREAEKFRKITMRVLTMQLNSITIMDLIAYGGAALGVIMAVTQYAAGHVDLGGCFLIILLSADFFIPMRRLGSFFHVAMNGIAASSKIFKLLALPEPEKKTAQCPDGDIVCRAMTFSYEEGREILHGIDMEFKTGSLTSIVGESGCGKSTVAAILMGRNKGYGGTVSVGGVSLSEIMEESLMRHITYVGANSYLFKGTVRDNLVMARPDATEEQMWDVLSRVRLDSFLKSENGLDTVLLERGDNFSGGQRQRLALARALLHDSPVYLFDEATSNIDAESENDIMEEIHRIAKIKTVVLISHRLANVERSDRIYVMESGGIVQSGSHEELLNEGGTYSRLRNAQKDLEGFVKGAYV